MSCRVENHSQAPIPQILFPDLWGLTPFNGVEGTELRLSGGVIRPFAGPLRAPETAPPWYNGSDGLGWKVYRARGAYYGENPLRWLDFGGLRGGFSVFQRKWGTQDHRTF
jgi:hypothetical protein